MASNPPSHMEDQTDEDFFDKLVEEEDDDDDDNDDVAPVKRIVHDQGNDSDDAANAFENMGIGDTDAAFGNSGVGNGGIRLRNEGNSKKLDKDVVGGNYHKGDSVSSMSDRTMVNRGNCGAGSRVERDSSAGKSNVMSNLEVKEVGWNAFNAESNGGIGFGSYSDFFSELGDTSGGEFPGKVYGGDSTCEVKHDESGIQNYGLNNSVNYDQYQEGQVYDASVVDNSTNEQDLSSSQYWENLYPGWRYDHNTGQWYQVEDYNADSSAGWIAASDAKAEVSYMQQTTAQSAAGTLVETGTTESVSSWNQVSQGNNGYPEHMIFDPQYPGWYYDMIAQEWRSLETYNSSIHSVAQGHENEHASAGSVSHNDNILYTNYGQAGSYGSQDAGSHAVDGSWGGSYGTTHQHGSNKYSNAIVNRSDDHVSSVGNKQFDHSYGSSVSVNKDQQKTSNSFGSVHLYNNENHNHKANNGAFEVKNFAPSAEIAQHFNYSNTKFDDHKSFSNDYAESKKSFSYSQQSFQAGNQYSSYAPHAGRSSAGRPPHALVTFGFGGKLVVMKDSSQLSSSYGSQNTVQRSVSVLNLMEVVTGSMNSSSIGNNTGNYFRALAHQSFPGPLVGGNVGSKELNKWIDERIAHCGSPDMDYKKGERLRLLLSLLKIACQHYGKLRSPFGTDTILKEHDIPESAVAKLFASAKMSGKQFNQYGTLSHCLQNFPSEGQMRATASEVQNLLVSGKKKDALQCAQEGQLWGPALVLASQLGEQHYVNTVKQMALRQLVAGSPLRTLCLLIAGQPADVFSSDSSTSGNLNAFNMPDQPAQFGSNSMLDGWDENLAVITANRTKGDELVIMHLGDCLWKERSEITAAHICYLVAEANFESYSDSARLCLIGADHWKFPRTYASPEAIQRTELYEYSKVLGNSQFILLPFQPYKLIYAYMLAEVGKVSDSLKYCQAALKSLKTGRAPEVETWKQLLSSLEERIRTHQQGGYADNLAPAKLVGKLLNFFDSTAHRVVGGGLPPPAPSSSQGNVHGNDNHQPATPRVSNSQSTMAMSSLVPSASMEPISEWTSDGNRMTMSNRSVSEPDFGRSPRQETSSLEAQGKGQVTDGASRFSRFGFGSQLFQKTMGLVLRPRPGNQAKLGETNKFYYDEKLKRWVEEGAEPPTEETALPPPPPTTAAFQNGSTEYNLKSALKAEGSPANEGSHSRSSSLEQIPGIPPMPPTTNQFSARGRTGVRSRYVDTFNQGGGSSANSFQSPSVPSVKPPIATNAKFFIPSPSLSPSSNQQTMADTPESNPEDNFLPESPSTSSRNDWSYQSPQPMSPVAMHRYQSGDNISNQVMPPVSIHRFPSGSNILNQVAMSNARDARSPRSRRTASWGGSCDDPFGNIKVGEVKPLGEALGMPPSTYMSNEFSSTSTHRSGSFGDLHEVDI